MDRSMLCQSVSALFVEPTCSRGQDELSDGGSLEPEMWIPTPTQIRLECQRIQAGWDERETLVRILRSEMACKFGVCRNL